MSENDGLSLHFTLTSMQKNPENSSFDAQNINKSAPKCFCCKYRFQGLQKHQNVNLATCYRFSS